MEDYTMTDLARTIVEAQNLNLILDTLHIGIIAHTPERKITFFNNEAEKITGYSKKEVIGRDCHDIFQGPFCGGKCSFCNGAPSFFPSKLEYPVTTATKDGSTIQLEMTVSPIITADSVFKGVVASFRDMTELFNLSLKAEKMSNFAGIIGKHKVMQDITKVPDMPDFIIGVINLRGNVISVIDEIHNFVGQKGQRPGAIDISGILRMIYYI